MLDLAHIRVLVTRPAPFGPILCEKIREAGGEPIFFPTLVILPPREQPQKNAQLEFDWIIFISPQAVTQSLNYFPSWPKATKIAAVGRGTAQVLEELQWPVTCFPEEDWSSEGLLDLPEFKHVKGLKIALIKGEGGRETLEQTLITRGAEVTPLVVYQRALETPKNIETVLSLLRTQKIDVVICTSYDGLRNLTTLLNTAENSLYSVPVLVISARLSEKACQLGFKHIILAKNASYPVLIETLAKEKSMTNTDPMLANAPERKRTPMLTKILTFVLGLLILLSLGFGLYVYHSKNVARNQVLQSSNSELQARLLELDQKVNALGEEIKSQEDSINTVRQTQTGFNRDEWRLVEAEFLTKMANDKVQLEKNAAEAIMLLQSADTQLQYLNDSKFLAIRKALAADIVRLQAVPQVDITGIYVRLAALDDEIIKLPLPGKPEQKAQVESSSTEKLSWWRRGLLETKNALARVVTVRHRQEGVLPLILPEQQDFLYQNLHATLENAMWGLLHQQPKVYEASLQQAIIWVQKYFVTDSPVTKSVVANLTELHGINVRPALPTLQDALQAFQTYFSGSEVKALPKPANQ